MTSTRTPTRLDRLYRQRDQLQAKIKLTEARNRTQARKDDTRRKVIAGALALEHAAIHDGFASVLNHLIDQYVKRPQDRALFGLAPIATPAQGNDNSVTDVFDESAQK